MRGSKQEKVKRNTLNLRISQEFLGLINRAAQVAGKSRAEFVLDAARRAAADTLLNQTIFTVDPEAHLLQLKKLTNCAAKTYTSKKSLVPHFFGL